MQTYGRQPVAFVRGEGTRLWDSEGKEYLDFLAGLARSSLGHAHPEVADAIADQARTLLHVSNLYYNDVQPRLAASASTCCSPRRPAPPAGCSSPTPGPRPTSARSSSPAATGRPTVVPSASTCSRPTTRSTAGRSTTLAATGQPQKQETFQPLPVGFRQVEFADVDSLRAAMDERVCAVLLEPVQGEGGVQPAPPGYLEAVRTLCDEREALLMIDEVQTGLGRTGRWFGFEHGGDVRPDVVTMAKALGNGVPIGACWARADVAAAFAARRSRVDVRRPTARGAGRARRCST